MRGIVRTRTSHTRPLLSLIAIAVAILAVNAISSWLIPSLAIGITLAVSTCIILFSMRRWFLKLPVYDREFGELKAIANLAPGLNGLLMPLGIWAMEPVALVNMISMVQSNQYNVIVECGAGISTLLLGKVLRQQGFGHLYAIEEDERWFRFMARLVVEQELDNVVELVYAPIESNDSIEIEPLWYSTTVVNQIIDRFDHIDLLIVDGPKSVTPLSRYPALPFFASRVDNRTLIVFDDVERDYEREVLRQWEKEFPLDVEIDVRSHRWQAYLRLNRESNTGQNQLSS